MSFKDEMKKAAIEAAVNIDLDHTTVSGDVVQKILKLNLARKYEAANHLLINSIHDAYGAAHERDTMAGFGKAL